MMFTTSVVTLEAPPVRPLVSTTFLGPPLLVPELAVVRPRVLPSRHWPIVLVRLWHLQPLPAYVPRSFFGDDLTRC